MGFDNARQPRFGLWIIHPSPHEGIPFVSNPHISSPWCGYFEWVTHFDILSLARQDLRTSGCCLHLRFCSLYSGLEQVWSGVKSLLAPYGRIGLGGKPARPLWQGCSGVKSLLTTMAGLEWGGKPAHLRWQGWSGLLTYRGRVRVSRKACSPPCQAWIGMEGCSPAMIGLKSDGSLLTAMAGLD
jgi:hypothetical protein